MIYKVKDADSKESREADTNLISDIRLYASLHMSVYGRLPGHMGLCDFRVAPADIREGIIAGLHEAMLERENLEEFLSVDR